MPENWEEVFNTIMAILTLIGAVNDPTTKGLTDSENAMTYDEPK
ncbi:phage holin [Streptococcus hyovaginalis]|nr:phage holin [Streptococcus hyovaginalis]MDY5974640.1 phage holin [Streptococcus hyovaginalis]